MRHHLSTFLTLLFVEKLFGITLNNVYIDMKFDHLDNRTFLMHFYLIKNSTLTVQDSYHEDEPQNVNSF